MPVTLNRHSPTFERHSGEETRSAAARLILSSERPHRAVQMNALNPPVWCKVKEECF
jgi:hypothetical protein